MNDPKNKKVINVELIDKAYDFCKSMFEDDEKFMKYWEDNYVKFIEDFSEHKFRSSMKKRKNSSKEA